jgi:hypothetical protein
MEHFENKVSKCSKKVFRTYIYVKIPNIYIYIDVGRKHKMESYM